MYIVLYDYNQADNCVLKTGSEAKVRAGRVEAIYANQFLLIIFKTNNNFRQHKEAIYFSDILPTKVHQII